MRDFEQWKWVALLYAHGFRFWSYGHPSAPTLPAHLKEVGAYVRTYPKHPYRVGEN